MDAYMIAESVDLAFLKRFCHMVARKIRKEDRITGKEMESLFNIYRSALNGAKIFFDGFAFTKFKEHKDLCVCNNCKLKLKKSGDEKQ
jgi:hypothetical protein